MVKLHGGSIYVKDDYSGRSIIIFDKSPEQKKSDKLSEVARFGGQWRTPSYLEAYLYSASLLVEHGRKESKLDEIALPALFLQRHTLELLIKRMLSWIYDISDMSSELEENIDGSPSKKARRRLTKEHSISKLFNDLRLAINYYDFPPLPATMEILVKEFSTIEKTETFSRYLLSNNGKETINYLKNECTVPLVYLQEKLSETVTKMVYNADNNAYENELYEAWLYKARLVGRAG